MAGEEPTQGGVIAAFRLRGERGQTTGRALLRILAWGGATLALALGALLAVNAVDQDLSPDARSLLHAPARAAPPPAKNLYVALAGFQAPAGVSTIRYGSERIAEHNRLAAAASPAAPGRPRLEYAGETSWCEPRTGSCWANVLAHAAEIRAALGKNAELYRRYRALHDFELFVETAQASASAPVPATYVPADVRALFIADIALRVRGARTFDDRAEALVDLDRDIATWRLVLTSAPSLLPAMLASNYLHGDYALLADIVADRHVDVAAHGPRIAAMLGRMRLADWKIPVAIENETRYTAQTIARAEAADSGALVALLADADDAPSALDRRFAGVLAYFFEPNATLNLCAEHARRLRDLAAGDPGAFAPERERLADWRDSALAPSLNYLYNPVGKLVLGFASGALDAYPLRAYDTAAFHRAVGLAYEIRQRRIASDAIPAFMRAHPQWSTHPVSGETFQYDANAHALVVTPLGATPRERRFAIPVSAG